MFTYNQIKLFKTIYNWRYTDRYFVVKEVGNELYGYEFFSRELSKTSEFISKLRWRINYLWILYAPGFLIRILYRKRLSYEA